MMNPFSSELVPPAAAGLDLGEGARGRVTGQGGEARGGHASRQPDPQPLAVQVQVPPPPPSIPLAPCCHA